MHAVLCCAALRGTTARRSPLGCRWCGPPPSLTPPLLPPPLLSAAQQAKATKKQKSLFNKQLCPPVSVGDLEGRLGSLGSLGEAGGSQALLERLSSNLQVQATVISAISPIGSPAGAPNLLVTGAPLPSLSSLSPGATAAISLAPGGDSLSLLGGSPFAGKGS